MGKVQFIKIHIISINPVFAEINLGRYFGSEINRDNDELGNQENEFANTDASLNATEEIIVNGRTKNEVQIELLTAEDETHESHSTNMSRMSRIHILDTAACIV